MSEPGKSNSRQSFDATLKSYEQFLHMLRERYQSLNAIDAEDYTDNWKTEPSVLIDEMESLRDCIESLVNNEAMDTFSISSEILMRSASIVTFALSVAREQNADEILNQAHREVVVKQAEIMRSAKKPTDKDRRLRQRAALRVLVPQGPVLHPNKIAESIFGSEQEREKLRHAADQLGIRMFSVSTAKRVLREMRDQP